MAFASYSIKHPLKLGTFSECLGPIAQHLLLDLACRCFRQLDEHHGFRQFEARQMFTTEQDDIGFPSVLIIDFELDEGAGSFAPLSRLDGRPLRPPVTAG